ncbi:MAG TPA: SDR family oxidoreductase [bacterium]|nr:SDR family oxidoreductase [bacterium]
MRALVTGGAGFIGSHMVDLLVDSGVAVCVIDNLSTGRLENLAHHRGDPRVTIVEADMVDLEALRPRCAGVDYVFHFGGIGDIIPSIERPLDYMRANVTGTLAVLEAARQAGVKKLVYAASSSCYGSTPPVPTPEEAPVSPEYPYALSKYLGECAALHWGKVYGLPVISFRIFNAYGPRARTGGVYGAVFGVFLAQKLRGRPFTVVGDGTQRRDFVYATDVARAFLRAAESPYTQEIFNLGAGAPHSVNRLVELLGGEVVRVPKRPGEPDCTWAEIRKIQERLGWTPQVSFEAGVAHMLRSIDEWADAPVWTPETIEVETQTWFKYLGQARSSGRAGG